jgi:hypothetical protein
MTARDSQKENVLCALSKKKKRVVETTITGLVYLDMLQQFLIRHLDKDDQEGRTHFQQEGAPPHYRGEVRKYLSTRFPCRWIGRAVPIAWPPRSPNLTPLNFFVRGFVNHDYPR